MTTYDKGEQLELGVILIILAVLFFFLVSCGGDGAEKEEPVVICDEVGCEARWASDGRLLQCKDGGCVCYDAQAIITCESKEIDEALLEECCT